VINGRCDVTYTGVLTSRSEHIVHNDNARRPNGLHSADWSAITGQCGQSGSLGLKNTPLEARSQIRQGIVRLRYHCVTGILWFPSHTLGLGDWDWAHYRSHRGRVFTGRM